MRSWSIADLGVRSGVPQILSSSEDSRAIAIRLGAGERLADHQVHERAWIMPMSGEIEVSSPDASPISGGPGVIIEVNAKERHEVTAREDALLLLLLTPWPGAGHPGSVSLVTKRPFRVRPNDQAGSADPSPSATRDEDPWSLDPLSPLP